MCWAFSWGQSRGVVWGQLLLFLTFNYKGNISLYYPTHRLVNKKLIVKLLSSALRCNNPPGGNQDTITRIYLRELPRKLKQNSLIFYHWYLILYSVSISRYSVLVLPHQKCTHTQLPMHIRKLRNAFRTQIFGRLSLSCTVAGTVKCTMLTN